MKYLLPLFLVLFLIGAGCTKAPQTDIDVTSGDVKIEYRGEQEVTYDENGVPVTEVVLGGQPDVTFEMTVDNNAFSPDSITVQAGQKVAITFTEVTGTHTFTLEKTNTNVEFTAPRTVYLKAPTDPGTYTFSSSAGPTGTLIVE